MFPIAFPAGNIADRVAEGGRHRRDLRTSIRRRLSTQLGRISGRVTLNGAGVFGAHVRRSIRRRARSSAALRSTSRASFVIAGLAPGLYVVRVEPLDDADIDELLRRRHTREHQLQGDLLQQDRRRAGRRRGAGHRESRCKPNDASRDLVFCRPGGLARCRFGARHRQPRRVRSRRVRPRRAAIAASSCLWWAWTGGTSFGSADATLQAPDGSSLTLFKTRASLAPACGLEAHVGSV